MQNFPKRALSHPSVLLLGSTAASMLVGIISAAVQARVLGPTGRGELATAMVPGTLLAMLLCIGLPDYVARKAAQAADKRRLSKLALIASLVIGAAAVVPYVLLSRFQASLWSNAWWLLVAFACTVPLFVYGYCLGGLAMGASYWKMIAVVRVVPGVLSVLCIVALALTLPTVTPLLVGLVLIGFTAVCPLIYLTLPSARPRGEVNRSMVTEAASFGFRGWTAGSVALVNQRVDLLMMTGMAANADLGYYAVATTLAAILNAVATSIAMPARNKVSRGDNSRISQTTASTMLVVLVLAAFVVVMLPVLVHVLLGPEYLPAIPVMSILLFMQVPLAGAVVLTQSLIGAGYPGSPLIGEIVALVVTIALILVFFPAYGIIASAIATGVGNILSLGVLLALVQRHIQREPLWRYFFISPRRLLQLTWNR